MDIGVQIAAGSELIDRAHYALRWHVSEHLLSQQTPWCIIEPGGFFCQSKLCLSTCPLESISILQSSSGRRFVIFSIRIVWQAARRNGPFSQHSHPLIEMKIDYNLRIFGQIKMYSVFILICHSANEHLHYVGYRDLQPGAAAQARTLLDPANNSLLHGWHAYDALTARFLA
eukprot:scaffold17577_cov18-Prasinocladus_malaysianus.AAC.1